MTYLTTKFYDHLVVVLRHWWYCKQIRIATNCSRNYVYTDVINCQSALVRKRKWLPAFGHRCIMQIRQLAVPAPRQRHIYGRIVEVLCTWSNGGTGAGRHRNA